MTEIDLGDGSVLDAQILRMLDGMIRGRAKGRADRGLPPEDPPWTRAVAVRKLLDDRIGFTPKETVALARLKPEAG